MAHDYPAELYGDRIADVYDVFHAEIGLDTEAAVEVLAEFAGSGPVLELAIGTGRIALPLAERGLEVHGIDASERMVEKLREKPGGDAIPVTIGDFADVGVEGRYSLIFVVFNTLFGLQTQEEQVRCFANAAEHLADGGHFVIEAFVPDPARWDRGQRVQATRVTPDEVTIDVSRWDPLAQRAESSHLVLTEQGVKMYPVSLRMAFPAELDLMARLAGLELKHRWASWSKDELSPRSGAHVSVYAR